MAKSDREQMIIEEAVKYFSEVGIEGQTRDLAKRLGVTQPLIFKYFGTKDELLERIYQELVQKRWRQDSFAALRDRTRPLVERILEFYTAYTGAISPAEWRLFYYFARRRMELRKRYFRGSHGDIFRTVCAEVRAATGLPPPEEVPISRLEEEVAWALHGSINFIFVRDFVYNTPPAGSHQDLLRLHVEMFVRGAPAAIACILNAEKPAKQARKARVSRV